MEVKKLQLECKSALHVPRFCAEFHFKAGDTSDCFNMNTGLINTSNSRMQSLISVTVSPHLENVIIFQLVNNK